MTLNMSRPRKPTNQYKVLRGVVNSSATRRVKPPKGCRAAEHKAAQRPHQQKGQEQQCQEQNRTQQTHIARSDEEADV